MEISFQAAAFDLDGQRFATVYKGLDSQKLCVTELSSGSSTHTALPKGVQVTTLAWAAHEKSKKRKRSISQAQDLITIGASNGKIYVFSVSKGEILGNMSADTAAISDLTFANGSLYSLSSTSLIKWDIQKLKQVDEWTHEMEGLQKILSLGSEFVLASTMPHLLDWSDPATVKSTLPGFTTPIGQLCATTSGFAASAEEDRQIQVYGNKNVSFMCPSNILHMSSSEQFIAAVCEDGKVRIYEDGHVKSQVHIRRSTGETVAVHHVLFAGDFLVLAWPEVGASVAVTEPVKWFDGEPIAQITEIKDAATPQVTDHTNNGVDAAAPAAYKENAVHISSGANFQALEDSDDDEGEVTLADRLEALQVNENNNDAEEEEDQVPQKNLQVRAPGSFAVLLNQALSNDDKQLLETCLAEKDEKMIKSSIVRLEPALATKLLERLAEKIARTQHRSLRLLSWIRWVMVVHGGYLVTVPSLLRTLASLYATLNARTASLPKLLALQGRLDLLSAQIDLRQEIIDTKRNVEDEEDVPEFVYNVEEIVVNGEEDLVDDDESDDDDLEDEEMEEMEDVEDDQGSEDDSE